MNAQQKQVTMAMGKDMMAAEYNHIAIPQWDRFFNSRLNTVKGRLNKFLPLYLESWELYNSITDPNIKSMAISQLPHAVIYKYVSEYIGWQIKKLKGVPYHHYTVPPTMGGMG